MIILVFLVDIAKYPTYTAFYSVVSKSFTKMNITLLRWTLRGRWNSTSLFTQRHQDRNGGGQGPAFYWNFGWASDEHWNVLTCCSLVYTQNCIPSFPLQGHMKSKGGGKKVVVHLHNLGSWKLKTIHYLGDFVLILKKKNCLWANPASCTVPVLKQTE